MSYEITYNGQTIKTPASWNDLSRAELKLVSKLFGNMIIHMNEVEDERFTKEYYSSQMLLIKKFLKMGLRQFSQLSAAQIADLLPICDFIPNVDLNQQHFPTIRIGLQKFYGPEPGLKKSTFEEFISADTYFINISKKQNVDYLFKLIAVLYRPKQSGIKEKQRNGSWDGDYRQKFNDSLVDARASFFQQKLSKELAFSILYFYWGFRTNHVLRFKNLFEEPPKDGKEHVKKVGNQYGWAGTLLEISGSVFGNVKETSQTNWFTVFVELSRQVDLEKQREFNKK